MRTIADVVENLPQPREDMKPLVAPTYELRKGNVRRAALAVPTMANHMSDEGWQLMLGLKGSNYVLCSGKEAEGIDFVSGDVRLMLSRVSPSVVVVQDKREWFSSRLATAVETFYNVYDLRKRKDVFKVTVIKDSHHNPRFHRESAEEIGCHAWICYYHPEIVCRLAPYVRKEHLIRVYHTVNPRLVPEYKEDERRGCLISGAQQRSVYPMRWILRGHYGKLPDAHLLSHPGYHCRGSNTPDFLQVLSRFKVAVCTSSIYGYSLRKLVEATACGCRVITDLPADDPLPYIDENLERIDLEPQGTFLQRMKDLLERLYETYDPNRQARLAKVAKEYYSYHNAGMRLFEAVERARHNYHVDRSHPELEALKNVRG